eukprot:scaffold99817_cov62-Phaeocystis_antarctica.AAC.3
MITLCGSITCPSSKGTSPRPLVSLRASSSTTTGWQPKRTHAAQQLLPLEVGGELERSRLPSLSAASSGTVVSSTALDSSTALGGPAAKAPGVPPHFGSAGASASAAEAHVLLRHRQPEQAEPAADDEDGHDEARREVGEGLEERASEGGEALGWADQHPAEQRPDGEPDAVRPRDGGDGRAPLLHCGEVPHARCHEAAHA